MTRSYMCFHMQDPFPDWNVMLQRARDASKPYRLLKSFHPEDYPVMMAASPATLFVYRNFADKDNQGGWIQQAGQSENAANAAADDFISRFKDSVLQHVTGAIFVESLNEEYPTNDPGKLHNIVEFDRAFIRRLPLHIPFAFPVVFTAAIGNPDHHEVDALIPLAYECAMAGGAMGYHAYTSVDQGVDWIESQPHQYDLHLRWARSFDAAFNAEGISVDWMLGEGGPIKSNSDGYGPVPHPGWKHESVYNNNVGAYIDHLARLDLVLHDTVAAHEGRLLGMALFTIPGRDQWRTFDLPAEDITNYIIAADLPPHPEPEPPEEPVSELITQTTIEGIQSNVNFIELEILQAGQRQGFITFDLPEPIDEIQVRQWDQDTTPGLDLPALVIDVSGHQRSGSRVNLAQAQAAGIDGVIIRASNGIRRNTTTTDEDGVDVMLEDYVEQARAINMPFGLYHFYNAGWGTEQISHWLDIVSNYPDCSLGLWLDFENTSPDGEVEIMAGCLAALDQNNTNQLMGIYTGAWWWNSRVPIESSWPTMFRCWAANWVSNDPITTPPPYDQNHIRPHHWQQSNVWQFTSKGGAIADHTSESLDVNWFLVD